MEPAKFFAAQSHEDNFFLNSALPVLAGKKCERPYCPVQYTKVRVFLGSSEALMPGPTLGTSKQYYP